MEKCAKLDTSEPASIEWMEFEALDLKQLAQEDAATANFKDAPWRFGIDREVQWDAETHGTWTQEGEYDVWSSACVPIWPPAGFLLLII